MWLLDQKSPSILFSGGTSYPFLYLVLSTPPGGISHLISVWFFFFFLIGHHPQPPGTMKNHWSFLKQEVTRSIWGFIRQVSWNLWYGPAHVSNLGLGASSQPCSVLIPLDVSAESRGIFRSSLCRVTPAGWVVPVENSSLGIGLWSYNLSVVPGPFF